MKNGPCWLILVVIIIGLMLWAVLIRSKDKDQWPVENVDYIISGYGDSRIDARQKSIRYHPAIDIPAPKGTPVFEKIGGIFFGCFESDKITGWKVFVGNPFTKRCRIYSHIIPTLKIRNMNPGKSIVFPGTRLGTIHDFNSDGNSGDDHLHYGYVKIDKIPENNSVVIKIIEGYANPLDRLIIGDELKKKLKGKEPEILDKLIFTKNGDYSSVYSSNKISGKIDIIVHAKDEMGAGSGKGSGEPGVYKISWQLINPGYNNIGNSIEFNGVLNTAMGSNIHDLRRELNADFHNYYIVTNRFDSDGYWYTNESRVNPGNDAENEKDAKFPDGEYGIKITVFEHPAFGVPQRKAEYFENVTVSNF